MEKIVYDKEYLQSLKKYIIKKISDKIESLDNDVSQMPLRKTTELTQYPVEFRDFINSGSTSWTTTVGKDIHLANCDGKCDLIIFKNGSDDSNVMILWEECWDNYFGSEKYAYDYTISTIDSIYVEDLIKISEILNVEL